MNADEQPLKVKVGSQLVLTWKVADIKVGERFRKSVGDIDSLAANIAEVGLLHPIVIDAEGNLTAGARRLAACRKLRWRKVPVRIVDLDADGQLSAQLAENTERVDLTPDEALAISDARLEREQERARERETLGKVSPGSKGRAKDLAAEGTGYSAKTLEKVRVVNEAVARDPSLAHVKEFMETNGNVDRAYKTVVAAGADRAKWVPALGGTALVNPALKGKIEADAAKLAKAEAERPRAQAPRAPSRGSTLRCARSATRRGGCPR